MDGMKPGGKALLMLRVGFLIGSIYIVLIIVDVELVYSYLLQMPLYILFILVLVNLFRSWLHGLRWQLLNPDLTEQLNRWHYFRFTMISHTFNLIMPGALGGDFARAGFTLKTVKNKRADNMIAIAADRFVGLLSILILGSLAFLIAPDIPDRAIFYRFFALIYLAVAGLLFVLTSSYLHNFLESHMTRLGGVGVWLNRVIGSWKSALQYFMANKRKVILSLLICLPIHITSFFTAYILAGTLGIEISFFAISLIITLMWLVTAIPITISGAGVRELSLIYLFSIYGVGAEPATALSIYIYIISLLLGLLGLLLIVDWGKYLTVATLKN